MEYRVISSWLLGRTILEVFTPTGWRRADVAEMSAAVNRLAELERLEKERHEIRSAAAKKAADTRKAKVS